MIKLCTSRTIVPDFAVAKFLSLPSIIGLITDRNAFIKIVRNENKRFRPLGKFITEFTRNIEVKKPNSLFSGLETAVVTKRPKREV